jgi:hypothetical protein
MEQSRRPWESRGSRWWVRPSAWETTAMIDLDLDHKHTTDPISTNDLARWSRSSKSGLAGAWSRTRRKIISKKFQHNMEFEPPKFRLPAEVLTTTLVWWRGHLQCRDGIGAHGFRTLKKKMQKHPPPPLVLMPLRIPLVLMEFGKLPRETIRTLELMKD